MAKEIEAKFRLADPAPLRARLRELDAARLARVHEINRIFDTAERTLLENDCALRLRECRPPQADDPLEASLTFKGPRESARARRRQAKSREEVETRVADAPATAAILTRLGFHELIRYEKRRETWQIGDCTVCLDELPQLGWFAEIEGPSAAAVDTARTRLNLSDSPALRDTYVDMAATHGEPDSLGRRILVFEP